MVEVGIFDMEHFSLWRSWVQPVLYLRHAKHTYPSDHFLLDSRLFTKASWLAYMLAPLLLYEQHATTSRHSVYTGFQLCPCAPNCRMRGFMQTSNVVPDC